LAGASQQVQSEWGTVPTILPQDCSVSGWSAWGACSTSCGGGAQTRSRSVLVASLNGGASCPPLSDSQACNAQPCPVDCQVSGWGGWGACSVACGGGTQVSIRTVLVAPANGGLSCPTLSQSQTCNNFGCPVDCQVSAWQNSGGCSVPCGGGTQAQYRTTIVNAANGGAACPALQQTVSCNTQACAGLVQPGNNNFGGTSLYIGSYVNNGVYLELSGLQIGPEGYWLNNYWSCTSGGWTRADSGSFMNYSFGKFCAALIGHTPTAIDVLGGCEATKTRYCFGLNGVSGFSQCQDNGYITGVRCYN